VTIQLDDVHAAAERIADFTFRTPLRLSEWLSGPDANVYFKIETIQPTCSYKIRGAFNAAQRFSAEGGADLRLVTASAGNHGRALAYAAGMFDLPLTVFIARGAPRAKIDAIAECGAELRPCADYDEAEREAKAFARSGGGIYVSPYSHPDVIAGAGTIGLELAARETPLDAVVVPIGGGGLISGIGIALKALSPKTRIIGVEAAASCPFTTSLAAGRLVTIDVQPSLADGLTGNLDPDTITLDIVRAVVDEIVVVDEEDLRRGLAGVVTHEHLVIEGAAAAGPAALLSGRIQPRGSVAVILSGANIDLDVLARILR
jgi:threonine dehydratase